MSALLRPSATSADDLAFAGGQLVEQLGARQLRVWDGGELGDQPTREARRQQRVAAGEELDRPDELGRIGVLEEQPAGAGAQRGEDALVLFGGGQQHHRDARVGEHPAGGLDAVQPRQRGVDEHDVGAQAASQRDRFLAGGRLADDADLAAGLQQRAKAGADQRLTVGDQHPDGRGGSGTPVETGARVAVEGDERARQCVGGSLRADHW